MDDDLKAAIAEVEAFGRLIDAERETSEAFTVEDKAMRRMVRAQRTLLSALRQRDEVLRVCEAVLREADTLLTGLGYPNAALVMAMRAEEARAILTGSETNA